MLRLLLTLLLLMPLATQASEGEFFLAAKPAEQASSHRSSTGLEGGAFLVGAGVPANGLQSSLSALSYLSRRNQGACRYRE